jgi:RNA polymerase sigma-B factor
MTPRWHARAEHSACDLSALFRRCSAGDRRAREEIILGFLPYARRLAWIYEGRGEPIEDLRQTASVGLIKAVDRYSPERGDGFLAYARPMILGEIRRHFRDTTWRVHVPRPVREQALAVLLAEKELWTASGAAEPEAIANYLGIGREEVTEARRALEADSPRSLDASYMASDGHALPLSEVIGADDLAYARVELCVGIRQALLTLKPRDQKVLLFRLAWEMSQDEIAGRVGLSQMHVSRILRKAGAALTASCGLVTSAPRKSLGGSLPSVRISRLCGSSSC